MERAEGEGTTKKENSIAILEGRTWNGKTSRVINGGNGQLGVPESCKYKTISKCSHLFYVDGIGQLTQLLCVSSSSVLYRRVFGFARRAGRTLTFRGPPTTLLLSSSSPSFSSLADLNRASKAVASLALALAPLVVTAAAGAVEDAEVAAAEEEQHPEEDNSSTLASKGAPCCERKERERGLINRSIPNDTGKWKQTGVMILTMWAEFSLEPSCVCRSVGALVEGPYWPQMELFCWSAAFSVRR